MAAKCEDFLIKEATGELPGEENQQIWGEGLAVAIHVLLPIAIAGVLWGRKIILSKILLHLDKACLSVFWPSFSKREKVLKWTMTHLPYLDGGLETIWNDGSQLCTLINSVVPGACPNPHRHWKKPPTHGQALAYKYLGVVPVFTDSDFSQKSINSTIEKTLIEYMMNVQNAVSKISHDEELTFSNHYIARGMGLVTGEQYRKTVLYIYPNNQNTQSDNLLINIRGPYNSHGVSVLYADDLAALYKTIRTSQRERERLVDEEEHRSFLKSLTGDFQNLLNVKYNREQSCDIDISIEIERNRAKVMFIPRNSGVYEVCLTTNGEHIAGSPYNINVEKNRSGLTDDLSEDDCKSKSKKRIIPKIIETPPENKHAYIKYEEKEKWRRMRKIRDYNQSRGSSTNTSAEEDVCYLTIKHDDVNNNNNNDQNFNDSLENQMLEVELPMKQVLLSDLDKMQFPHVTEAKVTAVKSQDIRDRIAALENSTVEKPQKKRPNLTLTIEDNNNNNVSKEAVNSNALKTIDVFQKIIDSNTPELQKRNSGEIKLKNNEENVALIEDAKPEAVSNVEHLETQKIMNLPNGEQKTINDLKENENTQKTINDNKTAETLITTSDDAGNVLTEKKSVLLEEMETSIKTEENSPLLTLKPAETNKENEDARKLSSLDSNDSIYLLSINADDDAKLLKCLSRSDILQQYDDNGKQDLITNDGQEHEGNLDIVSTKITPENGDQSAEINAENNISGFKIMEKRDIGAVLNKNTEHQFHGVNNGFLNPAKSENVLLDVKKGDANSVKVYEIDASSQQKVQSGNNVEKNGFNSAGVVISSSEKPEITGASTFGIKNATLPVKESQNHTSSGDPSPKVSLKESFKRMEFLASGIPQGSTVEKRIQRLANLGATRGTNLKINKLETVGKPDVSQTDSSRGIARNKRETFVGRINNNVVDLKSPAVMKNMNGNAANLIKECVFDMSLKFADPIEEPASPVLKNTAPEDLPSNREIQVSDVSAENIKEAQTGKGKMRKWKTVDEPECPQLAEDDNCDLRLSFMKRKEFWSKLSTTSINSLNSSCLSLNCDRRYSSLSRLQVKKGKAAVARGNLGELRAGNPQQFRSLDFIDKRRIQRSDSCGIRDRYGSLDDLYFPSVKERRGLFLKEMMQDQARHVINGEKQAKAATRELIHKLEEKAACVGSRSQDGLLGRKTKNLFGSIHDKIKLFDAGFNPKDKVASSNKIQDITSANKSLKETWERKLNQLPENGTIKTKIKERFEKAQMFFKTLENVKQHKHEQNLKTSVMRRHSWSSNSMKLEVLKTGGSLRNLSTSERLPLNTLSKDHRNDVGSSVSLVSSCSSSGDAKCVDYEELKKLQVNLFLMNNNKKARKSVNDVFN